MFILLLKALKLLERFEHVADICGGGIQSFNVHIFTVQFRIHSRQIVCQRGAVCFIKIHEIHAVLVHLVNLRLLLVTLGLLLPFAVFILLLVLRADLFLPFSVLLLFLPLLLLLPLLHAGLLLPFSLSSLLLVPPSGILPSILFASGLVGSDEINDEKLVVYFRVGFR